MYMYMSKFKEYCPNVCIFSMYEKVNKYMVLYQSCTFLLYLFLLIV